MPLSGGASGAHDDSMHQGSAKRDVADGLAGLGSLGELLAPGSDLVLTRDGSENIELIERTSGEIVARWTRIGVDDYEFRLHCGAVACMMLNDSMKDAANGVAALDAGGHVLAPGYRFTAARGVAEQITIRERTSDERVFRWIRIGADDYEARVTVGGVEKVVQHAGLKDVVNGIAALDAAGNLLVPAGYLLVTRDGSDNVILRERTSNETVVYFNRVGADNFEGFIQVSGVARLLQHAGLKDVANGIAGLDASVKLSWDQLPLPMLTVAQFQANAGTGTADNPQTINNTSVIDGPEFDVVGEYAQVLFPHPMWMKEYRHYGFSGIAGDGRWKIQIYHDGAWVDNTVAIPLRILESWSDWVALTIPVYTQGIRFVATTIDSTFGISSVRELEIRG